MDTFADVPAAKAKIAGAQAGYQTYAADIDTVTLPGESGLKSVGTIRGNGELYAAQMTVTMSETKQQVKRVRDEDGFIWDEQTVSGEVSVTKRRTGLFDAISRMPLATALDIVEKFRVGPGNLQKVLDSYARLYDLNAVREETLNDVGVLVFTGTLKEPMRTKLQSVPKSSDEDEDMGPTAATFALVFRMAADLVTIRITIAETDGLPRIIEGFRADGTSSIKQTFKNVVVNPPIDDAVFTYTPPPGVEVVDFDLALR